MEYIREFSYLEAGNLDRDEPRHKANNCDACTVVVLRVCMLRECEGVRVTAMMVRGWMMYDECMTCGWFTWFRYCV